MQSLTLKAKPKLIDHAHSRVGYYIYMVELSVLLNQSNSYLNKNMG